ncbi:VWA domain-containing protein [Patescibacteria group bacterium]|nr:MAG: VWA domain-containing protein [Patescibacteria group bacterium]
MYCMEWSQKRKILYSLAVTIVVVLLASYPTYLLLRETPTCFDKKQNGTETGIDCGGSCSLMCSVEVKAPRIVWAKVFPINGNVYDIAAYVENVNINAGVKNLRYTIRVFDSANKILAETGGSTELAPGSRVLLFETGVTFSGIVDHTEVSFNDNDLNQWFKATSAPYTVVTKNQILKNADTKPRFDAVLVNTDLVNDVTNLTLSAIIYDPLRRPIAVSKTYVEKISRGGEQNIFFTWPNRFTKNPKGGICTTPVDTMLVFDRSGSMDVGRKTPPEPLTTAKNAASAYVESADITDKVGIVSFAVTASNPIDHGLSTDHDAVKLVTEGIAIEKGSLQYTNLGDALKSAFSEIGSERHTKNAKQIIVALTDGVSNRPIDPANSKNEAYAEEYAALIARDAKGSGVQIYTIGLGNNINEAFLRDSIATSPTHYFNAPTAESLKSIYKSISETVCKPENFITEIVVTPRAVFVE